MRLFKKIQTSPEHIVSGIKQLKKSKTAMAVIAAIVILGVGGSVAAMTMTGNQAAENAVAIEKTDTDQAKNKPSSKPDTKTDAPKPEDKDAAKADGDKTGAPAAQNKAKQSPGAKPAQSQPTPAQGGVAAQPAAPSVMGIKSITLSANIGADVGGCGAAVYPYNYLILFSQGAQSLVLQPRWEVEVFEGTPRNISIPAPFNAYTITPGTDRMYDTIPSEHGRGLAESFELGYRARLVINAPHPVYSNWLVLPQVRC